MKNSNSKNSKPSVDENTDYSMPQSQVVEPALEKKIDTLFDD